MNKSSLLALTLMLFEVSALFGEKPAYTYFSSEQDSIERQILYNGRVWRNLYLKIDGDPYLFSTDFLPGTVTIDGKTFDNIKIRYDIYNDQILILTDKIIILQLNKEMVDGFIIKSAEVNYRFKKIDKNDQSPVSGYVNVVYDKATSLFVKYKKEIDTSSSDNLFGVFYLMRKIYVMKDGYIQQISSRKQFLKLLQDKKQQVKNYIKGNKIKVSKLNPWSFATILEFYDSVK